MKALNEERVVKRVLCDFHAETWVEKIIVIDGGSTDYTIQEIKQFDKALVYVHPWLDWYHDAEICQSNIALSYIAHGTMCFILDFDERMSNDLKLLLEEIDEKGIPGGADIGNVPRKTFDVYRYEDPEVSPHAIIWEDGWPEVSHEIGQYPDYQTRLIKRNPTLHWVNSPHHSLLGEYQSVNLPLGCDILHYEKDDFRDRERIEKKWLRAQARRKELGLVADVFETKVKPELGSFASPKGWKCADSP
jgi:hypothetical protein